MSEEVTPDRWKQIRELFHAALDLATAEQRVIHVRDAAGSDLELAAAVCRLLELETKADNYFAGTALEHLGATVPEFRPGELVSGRFEIVRMLGKGGMGEVYLAKDHELQIDIALKRMRLDSGADGPDGLQARMRKEVLLARRITHPNVCRIYDAFRHQDASGDYLVLTMEYLEGSTLSSVLADQEKSRQVLTLPVVLGISEQIAEALVAAHGQGVVHRDLKPANVILIPEGRGGGFRAVVTDFGLAIEHRDGSAASERLTVTGGVVGTPAYMAPELLRGERATPQSDIYSFGVVLREMAGSATASTHDALRFVLAGCLAAEPADRFPSARELLLGLRSKSAVHRIWRSAGRATRRTFWMSALAAAGTAGSGALLWYGRSISDTDARRLLVFPIANPSRESQLEVVCTGTTSELLRLLAQAGDLRPIPVPASRTASVRKGGDPARFVLEGEFQQSERYLVLTMRLLDNRDNAVVWSRRFDGSKLQDRLEMQTELARSVYAAVGQVVGPAWRDRGPVARRLAALFDSNPAGPSVPLGPPTSSAEAFDDYIKAKGLQAANALESTLEAVRLLDRAIGADPNFGLAHAALAEAQASLMDYAYAPSAELLERGLTFARRAVVANPMLPETHHALSIFQQYSWDWEGAAASLQQALRIQPRHARSLQSSAGLKAQKVVTQDVLDEARMAVESDPYDDRILVGYNMLLFFAGRYDEAIQLLVDAAHNRNLLSARHNVAVVHAYRAYTNPNAPQTPDDWHEAFEHARIVAETETRREQQSGKRPAMKLGDRMFSLFHALRGDAASAKPHMERLHQELASGRTSPLVLARAYAALGDRNTALTLLEQGVRQHDRGMAYVKMNPFLRILSGEPRFAAIVKSMRLA